MLASSCSLLQYMDAKETRGFPLPFLIFLLFPFPLTFSQALCMLEAITSRRPAHAVPRVKLSRVWSRLGDAAHPRSTELHKQKLSLCAWKRHRGAPCHGLACCLVGKFCGGQQSCLWGIGGLGGRIPQLCSRSQDLLPLVLFILTARNVGNVAAVRSRRQ